MFIVKRKKIDSDCLRKFNQNRFDCEISVKSFNNKRKLNGVERTAKHTCYPSAGIGKIMWVTDGVSRLCFRVSF